MRRMQPTWLTAAPRHRSTHDAETARLIEEAGAELEETDRRYRLSYRVLVAVVLCGVIGFGAHYLLPGVGSDEYLVTVLAVQGGGVIAWVILLIRYFRAGAKANLALSRAEHAVAKEAMGE